MYKRQVEYFNVDHWPSENNVTTQAQLYEGTNIIEIHTLTMPSDGGNHTQGIENIDGTIGIATPGRNSANWSTSNDFVSFIPGGVTDNCGIASSSIDISTFNCSNIGQNIVTLTATDVNGNITTSQSIVTVEDNLAPVPDLATLEDVTAECEVTTLTAPTATDNCDVIVTNDAIFPITGEGTTTVVTWTYDDGNGNTATQTQNVVINDTTAPVGDISTLPDVISPTEVTSLTPPTATDNCNGTVTITNDATLPITTPGTTVVTWTYDDGNGNTSTQTQNVIILSDNPDLDSITINSDIFENPEDDIFYVIDCDNDVDFVEVELTSSNNATFDPAMTFIIETPRPGIYTQEVIVTAENGINTRVYNITVERRFSFNDIVEQKYNNTLIVNNNFNNNGGYEFVAYEWFKNGALVSTEQFFSEGDNVTDLLDPSASYSVRVTTAQGEVINTCIGTIELTSSFSLRILENPVAQGRQLNVRADFPAVELENATYQIYSSSGQFVMSVPVQGIDSSIELPGTLSTGIYRLLLVTSQRTEVANFIKN